MKTNEKNALIEHRISKAIAAIDDVDFLISNKKFLLAVNRIYYVGKKRMKQNAYNFSLFWHHHQNVLR